MGRNSVELGGLLTTIQPRSKTLVRMRELKVSREPSDGRTGLISIEEARARTQRWTMDHPCSGTGLMT